VKLLRATAAAGCLPAAAARLALGVLAFVPALACAPAWAALVEAQFTLAVKVSDAYGKQTERPIVVTTFVDDATPAPRPVLLINHGRAGDPASRAALGRARYTDNARWFAAFGFIVAVPTRIGYGVTGGDDVESSGPCASPSYGPGFTAAATQMQAVLEHLRARPDVAPDRAVVVGQSYGGASSIALAALMPAGVHAAINFAGGSGGNPQGSPRRPCQPNRLERTFGGYGRTARIPTLWLYTENDLYFGPKYPREWFEAFREAGGTGEFHQFPPHGEDGHTLFTSHPATWHPVVEDFLRRQGFTRPEPAAVPAAAPSSAPGSAPASAPASAPTSASAMAPAMAPAASSAAPAATSAGPAAPAPPAAPSAPLPETPT
jgi:dienelactone hydrolase